MAFDSNPAVECCLAEELGGAAMARELTRDALTRAGYQGAHEDVLLVVSELVTNALVHGDGAPTLRLRAGESRILVEVADDSPEMPKVRQPGPGGGWGMNMIKMLSASWGAVRRGTGKLVWSELTPARTLQMAGQTAAAAHG